MLKVEMKSRVMLLFFCLETILLQATEAMEGVQAIQLSEAIEGPSWGYYQGGIPPPFWSCLVNSEMCAGKMQSPVNIETNDVVKHNQIRPFHFSGLLKTAGIKMELKNTGLGVKVEFPNTQPIIKGGGLQGPHKLVGFHFHWGGNSQRGSEHTINGHQFAMEAHFVFLPTTDGPKHFAAVIGVLIYAGSYNQNYEHIVSKLKDVKNIGDKAVLDNFPVMDLFPETTRCWYRYCGSLTTPPCTETVIWTVFEQSICMSEDQISEFRKLMGKPEVFTEGDNNIVDTFRPVQPLLQRKVSLSCPRRRKYYYEQYDRNANEYGCINHGYGKQKCHDLYSYHSSGSNSCLWVDWYRKQ
ncbi:carbonic anhydrase 1-like [Mytilus californianus]|uniref:carbonic anhydrase 1-like n=1 Tax=Mytilus californianus TaxID=6549 RepID=UPI002247E653|nr:carbonic anhydrase 1-like [Mytilus californianus]